MNQLHLFLIRTKARLNLWRLGSQKNLSNYIFKRKFGRDIDWANPKDLNEKINWLKYYSDTSKWSTLADKYAVREFIESCGLSKMLVQLYGVWDDADAIDFDLLPQSFVLKSNNGSGEVLIIKDKKDKDIKELRKLCRRWLRNSYGKEGGEPHYLSIQPKIIAEELLDASKQSAKSSSLIDYKIWCFNGEPYVIFTIANRTAESYEMDCFDLNWNERRDMLNYNAHSLRSTVSLPKPASLDAMLSAARILAKGFPQVRVDFYEVNGAPYFGELTFTSTGGYMPYFTQKALLEMGQRITLELQ